MTALSSLQSSLNQEFIEFADEYQPGFNMHYSQAIQRTSSSIEPRISARMSSQIRGSLPRMTTSNEDYSCHAGEAAKVKVVQPWLRTRSASKLELAERIEEDEASVIEDLTVKQILDSRFEYEMNIL